MVVPVMVAEHGIMLSLMLGVVGARGPSSYATETANSR
jgi:hypothetical protein